MSGKLKLSEDGKVLLWAAESIIDAVIPEGVEEIKGGAFRYHDQLHTIQFPNTLVKIGVGAFSGCSNLRTLCLPSSLKTIEVGAFGACRFGFLQIPEGVTTIQTGAFFNSEIYGISIPSTMEEMIDSFIAIRQLYEVHIHVRDLDRLKINLKEGDYIRDCKYLYVPSGMIEAYKQHPVFGKIEQIIEMD